MAKGTGLTEVQEWTAVACPFCGEDGFDITGLRYHLKRGYCDQFEDDAVTAPAGRAALAERGGSDPSPNRPVVPEERSDG